MLICRVTIDNHEDLPEFKEFRANDRHDLLYVFSDISLKGEEGFRELDLMDIKCTFSKDLARHHAIEENGFEFIKVKRPDDSFYRLAYLSGEYSRFQKDPKLQPKFKLMYQTWVNNACSGSYDGHILALGDTGDYQAMITYKIESETAKIGLIGVSENMQGKGIGRALMNQVESKAKISGASILEVPTQQQNKSAMSFYTSIGYDLKKTEHIYHLWRN